MVIARLPVLADGSAEAIQELGHPSDVVVVRMGANDDREEPSIGRLTKQSVLVIGQRLDKTRKLGRRGHIDHEGPARSVLLCGEKDELRIAVTDIQQEVDQ